jgi:glycosyltransferase involved in cell wall biosynthesis
VQILNQRGVNSFEVVIGGDGQDREKLQQQVKELKLVERVHFLGALDRAQVKSEMQKCDVFVLPSLHETFGVVVGEAMACGKPVVVTRCGGPEFVVTEETGVLVDVASPEGLADAMVAFLSGIDRYDPSAIRESLVSRFGPKAFVNNVSAVYNDVWERFPAEARNEIGSRH